MVSVAITTTARNFDVSFVDWCAYHLKVVDRIFLWLDDPDESCSCLIPFDDRIQIEIGSQCNRGSVQGNLLFRQNDNTYRAINLCNKQGIDWLIHIDTDELFYPPNRQTLDGNLAEPNGHVTMVNHEVCPQWHADNPFRQCNYFKLSGGKLPFNFYGNGKSAVRCRPGVFSWGAHDFYGPVGRRVISPDMVILHYACASYDGWFAKYAHLGDFPDCWYDDPQVPITLPFHLKSRDIYKQCLIEGNFQSAVDFWMEQVLSPSELNQLLLDGEVGWYAPISEAGSE